MPRLDDSPIFLIGFMATGKSTVGRLVAERLGRRFVDLDDRVAERAGMPVPEIFRREGEPAFRQREAAALVELAGERDVVIACGGGTPTFGDNLLHMRARGVVVALHAQLATVLARALAPGGPGAEGRPLLAGGAAAAEKLYAAREAVYAKADTLVRTDDRDAAAVADEVVARARLRLGDVAVKLGERSYPIHAAPLADAGAIAAEMFGPAIRRAAVVTDDNVAKAGHAAAVTASLRAAGFTVTEVAFPAGEAHKTLAQAEKVAAACVAGGLDRKSAIVAVGGGVVGDLAGFVAATLFRGIPWGGVPTTLLSMVDSSIGGKTGVDLASGKNLVGAFWQPRFVLADAATLATLPRREIVAGTGEVLKYALLGAGDDVDSLVPFDQLPAAKQAELVLRCAAYKADVVAKDEREVTGLRAVLNLGHTVGHAIEAAALQTPSPLLHGEAVALGLVAAARLSARLGACASDLEARVVAANRRLGLPHELEPWLRPEVLAYMAADKKRAGGTIQFVVLERAGAVRLEPLAPAQIEGLLRPGAPG